MGMRGRVATGEVTTAHVRSRARFVAGDPLRGIAAMGVLLAHAVAWSLIHSGHAELVGRPFDAFGAFGGWVVASGAQLLGLFFALSGYLIARPFVRAFVERTPPPALPRYVAHRLLRIVPAFWVVLTISLLVVGDPERPTWEVVRAYLFALDWHGASIEVVMAQAWTLGAEMRFYLALPAAAALLALAVRALAPQLGRTARCWLVIALAGGWAVATVLLTDGANAFTNGGGVTHTAFAFGPGIALAAVELLPLRRLLAWRWTGAAASAVALLAASLMAYPWIGAPRSAEEFKLRYAALLMLLLGGLLVRQWHCGRTWAVLDNPLLRWLGSRSYAIYLLHIGVQFELARVLAIEGAYKDTLLVVLAVSVPVTFAAAELLHRCIELPFMRLRERPWRRERAGGAPSAREPSAIGAPAVAVPAMAHSADSSHQ